MLGRRTEVKQTTLGFPSKNSEHRLFSHRKTKSSNLLEKKPQILLMKWNSFLQTYHLFKQLATINNSLNSVNTFLKKKKEDMVIRDVPYIESEQISVYEREEENIDQVCSTAEHSTTKGSQKTKGSIKLERIHNSNSIKQSKQSKKETIVVSIRLSEKQVKNSEQQIKKSASEENFTDQQGSSSCEQEKQKKQESTNKNSKLQFSFEDYLPVEQTGIHSQQSQHHVEQGLRKTAFFTFHEQQRKKTNAETERKHNQENINNLNRQIKSKKVEVLLKLQTQQELRRQKAQKIIKEDREYLSNLMKKR